MPLQIIRQDITKMHCDAIVNASNECLFPGGGVDEMIHKAAGSELLSACEAIGGVEIGQSVITKGFALPAKYVIHTAGPLWEGGEMGEEALLVSCYRTALQLAKQYGCASVAFPLISSGLYAYPKDRVLRVAIDTISEFLLQNEMQVYIVVYDKTAFAISERLFRDVTAFVDDLYVTKHMPVFDYYREEDNFAAYKRTLSTTGLPCAAASAAPSVRPPDDSLFDGMEHGFSLALMKLMDEKGVDDVACYKKANVSKQTWHKILSDPAYKPSKNTVLSFAIALELSLTETQDLLRTVGYTLSRSNRFDIIVTYFLQNEIYDIFTIDETLFQFDQPTLGS